MSAPGVLSLSGTCPRPVSLRCAFHVEREVVVLFGASGAGKTSILECIAGFRRPEHGRIEIGGRVLFDAASGAVCRCICVAWATCHSSRRCFLT